MTWQIVIDFELPAANPARGDVGARILNFGEDLYRELRASGIAETALVDSITDQLCVGSVKTRKVRVVSAIVLKMLEKHNLADIAIVSPQRIT